MKTLLKGLMLVPLLLLYLFVSGIIRLAPLVQRKKRIASIRITSVFARIILTLLGVRIRRKHLERLHNAGKIRLIVSNHLSYIDVLVIASLVPSVFITSVELKNTMLLGTLARFSGSIFVERRKQSGLKREIEDIAMVLGQGMPVALFPEGTTSDGDRVQPFKIPLFDAAVASHVNIVPVCIRYTRVNNVRLTLQNRGSIFYYGGVTFSKHFLRFLTIASVDVDVTILNTIQARSGQSRKDLATETYQTISAVYQG